MTSSVPAYPSSTIHTFAPIVRLLAEAEDLPSFFTALQGSLPHMLPATRLDILSDQQHCAYQHLYCSSPYKTFSNESHTVASLTKLLHNQGYYHVTNIELKSMGRDIGWLILSRQNESFTTSLLAIGNQLASIIAMRLVYEQEAQTQPEPDSAYHQIKELQEELQAWQQRTLRVTGTAHDIRNLLMVISGYAELLTDPNVATFQTDIQAIRRAANDGQQLLRRMLNIATNASPRVGESSVALLPTLIRDTLRLAHPFTESRRDITIKTVLEPVPPIQGNAAELREVLLNLILNAINAMPQGGQLTIHNFSRGPLVLITVSDTGVGISPEQQTRIFQPFTTFKYQGSGLGLSISQSIIEQFGGTITFESSVGQGTTFTIALPALQSLANYVEA